MPITVSFDIETDSIQDANDRTRIQVCFLRLCWEHIGGSSWRYPSLGAQPASEDWFNHVIPALMYFRSIVEHSGSDTGYKSWLVLLPEDSLGVVMMANYDRTPILKIRKAALNVLLGYDIEPD